MALRTFSFIVLLTGCILSFQVANAIELDFVNWAGNGLDGYSDLNLPHGIAVNSSGSVYVLDTGHSRIGFYSSPIGKTGQSLIEAAREISEVREKTVKLKTYHPQGIALGADGSFYIADTGNHRIIKNSPDGIQYTIVWGVSYPRDLDIDPTGTILYVLDSGHGSLKKLDLNGRSLNFEGIGSAEISGFKNPYGMTVDAAGNIYVANSAESPSMIRKYNSDGIMVLEFGEYGMKPSQLLSPQDLSVDSLGNIWVADGNDHKLKRFDSEGKFIGNYGEYGKGKGNFLVPQKIEIVERDGEELLYVIDSNSGKLQIFDIKDSIPPSFDSVAAVGDGICESVVNFCISKFMNVYHRGVVAYFSNFLGGYDVFKRKITRQYFQAPVDACRTVGALEIPCEENPSNDVRLLLSVEALGIEKCAIIKQDLSIMGQQEVRFRNVVLEKGVWSWTGNMTDIYLQNRVEKEMYQIEGKEFRISSHRKGIEQLEMHRELAAFGAEYCKLTDAGQIESAMGLIHPVHLKFIKETLNAQAEGGWDGMMAYATEANRMSPQSDCSIIEASEAECGDKTVSFYADLGLKIDKCGYFVMQSLNGNEKKVMEVEMPAVHVDGKWYLMENS